MILGFDHVQIAIPEGGEDAARTFYCRLLGFSEVPKPQTLQGRGGLWLQSGTVQLHLGVEADFRPARKAHPALLVADLASLSTTLKSAGIELREDVPLPGYVRIFAADPFGNRIELMQRTS